MSLLYLIENLDRKRFKPVVLISLDDPAVDLFRNTDPVSRPSSFVLTQYIQDWVRTNELGTDIETHIAQEFADFSAPIQTPLAKR